MACDHCKKELEEETPVFSLELRKTLVFCELKCLDDMIKDARELYKHNKRCG